MKIMNYSKPRPSVFNNGRDGFSLNRFVIQNYNSEGVVTYENGFTN